MGLNHMLRLTMLINLLLLLIFSTQCFTTPYFVFRTANSCVYARSLPLEDGAKIAIKNKWRAAQQ